MADRETIIHIPWIKAAPEQPRPVHLRPERKNAVSQRSAETRKAISAVNSDCLEHTEHAPIDVETPMTTNIQTIRHSPAFPSLDPETRELPPRGRSSGDPEPPPESAARSYRYNKYPDTLDKLPTRDTPSKKELQDALARRELPWIRWLYDLFRRES